MHPTLLFLKLMSSPKLSRLTENYYILCFDGKSWELDEKSV